MSSIHFHRHSILISLLVAGAALCEEPPGVVINHISPQSQVYVGSPGIAVLPNGNYLAKHDEFGPKSTEQGDAITQVFRSSDRGQTWRHAATVHGMYWASIFVHEGDAYLMGTSKNHGATRDPPLARRRHVDRGRRTNTRASCSTTRSTTAPRSRSSSTTAGSGGRWKT